ncbi:MAG: hypothetical protein WCT77_12665 [Bacteroidota bacterium]
MYKIPIELDLKIFLNTNIGQICNTVSTITFFFERNSEETGRVHIGFINISGRFILEYKRKKNKYDTFPLINCGLLLNLLEAIVIDIYTDSSRSELTIVFENGYKLTLINNEMYESYELSINGQITYI